MSAGATGAAAAAAQQAKMREEEEKLTTYSKNDLDGWEFKIVRSVAGKIKGDNFRQLCDEEAGNGWELVEKFDDNRVRFKRKIDHRSKDQFSEIDPYRTNFGISESKFVFIILGVTLGTIGIVMAIIFGIMA